MASSTRLTPNANATQHDMVPSRRRRLLEISEGWLFNLKKTMNWLHTLENVLKYQQHILKNENTSFFSAVSLQYWAKSWRQTSSTSGSRFALLARSAMIRLTSEAHPSSMPCNSWQSSLSSYHESWEKRIKREQKPPFKSLAYLANGLQVIIYRRYI